MKIAKTFICLCFSASVGAARNSIDRISLLDGGGKDKCCCREVRPGHLSELCDIAPHTRRPSTYFDNAGQPIRRHRELILGTEEKLYCCKLREECVFKVFGAKHDIPVEKINPDRESATCAIGKQRTWNRAYRKTFWNKFWNEFQDAVYDVPPNRVNIMIDGPFQVHANTIPYQTKASLRFMLVEKSTDEQDREFFAPEFNPTGQEEDFAHGKSLPRLPLLPTEDITTWEEVVSFRQAHVNEYSRIMITQTTYGNAYGDIFCKVPQTLKGNSLSAGTLAVLHGIKCKGPFIMRKSQSMLSNAVADVPLYKGNVSALLTGPRVYTTDPRARSFSNRHSRRIFWASQAMACTKIPAAACSRLRRVVKASIDPIRLCQQFFEITPDAHIEAFLHMCDEPVDRKDALSWGMMPGMPNGAWPDEDEEREPNVDVKFASSESRMPEWQQVEHELKLAGNGDIDDFEEVFYER